MRTATVMKAAALIVVMMCANGAAMSGAMAQSQTRQCQELQKSTALDGALLESETQAWMRAWDNRTSLIMSGEISPENIATACADAKAVRAVTIRQSDARTRYANQCGRAGEVLWGTPKDGYRKVTVGEIRQIVRESLEDEDKNVKKVCDWVDVNAWQTACTNVREADASIAACTRFIAVNPTDASSFYYRGAAYRVKGQLDRAIADLSEAIRLAPDVTEFYLGRGTTNFAAGHFEAAVSDIARGVREKPGDGYAVVWVYLARLRANGPDALAELKINAEWVKRDEWPYAVVTLYLGRGSPEAVLAAAGKPDDRCEAHFYIGAWRLARGERAEASEALKAAVDTCPKDFVEYSGAQAELKRMAAAVSSERREVWVRFGCETVRSDTDRSIIKAERREGYFKSIRLVANGPIEFRDLRIHHIDRTFQDVRMPRAEQPAGASTPAIDLTVQNNAIERIDVIYRAKDTTRICVEGLD